MKKLIFMFLAILIAMPVYADLDKTLNKELEKEYKRKLKEFKKEKWQIVGTRSMEVALLKHYQKLNSLEDDAREYVGMSRTKTKNNGYQSASNNAVTQYAAQAGSTLKGRIANDLFADGADPDAEFDHFYAAYERLVEKEIKGEMTEGISLYRQLPDGTYEFMVTFVVSENAAAKARQRALNSALKDSAAAGKYADQISGFVNSPID